MATAASKSNGTNSDYEALEKQIAALKADISALSGTMKDIGAARAGAIREQGEAAVEQARAKGRAAYDQAEASVRDNPAMAVGIAAGIGFLTGLILGRR